MKKTILLTTLLSCFMATHAQKKGLGVLVASLPTEAPSIPKMIEVKGGTFMMGNTFGVNKLAGSDNFDDALPIHEVKLSTFKISETPITWAQYAEFCNETGYPMPTFPTYIRGTKQLKKEIERGNGYKYPVFANYYQADAYCKWLSKKTGKNFRLPTEAEWEFAARGGNKSTNSLYSGEFVRAMASKWIPWDLDLTVHKYPNALGIYNMSGGVDEWCSDWYSKTYYAQSPTENPIGPDDRADDTNRDSYKVIRGGAINNISSAERTVFFRGTKEPGAVGEAIQLIGFRIVLGENVINTSDPEKNESKVPVSLTDKLKELKSLFDQDLINKEEYDAARKKLLEN